MAVSSFSARTLLDAVRKKQSSKADIKRLIEESELKITSLESQISVHVELRDREYAIVAVLRHLISPIHTLPVELLTEIFECAIHDETHIEDVFRISQVCSDWRLVAHSTPRLWTRPIQVDLRNRNSADWEVYADGLKAWLERSAPLLLSISFTHGSTIKTRIPNEVLKVAPRCRSLDLSYHTPLWLIRRMAECRLDSLEELKLGPGTFKEDVDPSTFPSFATFTRLQILTTFVYSNALQNFIPWAQLTDLTLVGCGLPDIALDVLAQCSNLEKALVNITVWSLSPAKRDILVLGQLDNLILAFSGAGHVTPFFDCLSLPALDMLYVHFEDTASGEGSWSEAHFRITALQLRFPNITRLHLSKAWCLTSEDLKAILRHTQCLTKLYLTDVNGCFDDTVVDALSFKHGIEPLVPRLHDFLFQETQSNNFSEDILANAIASRWWTDVEMASRRVPPVVARWVNVELRGNFSEHFADRMQILQCKGLPVACIRTSVGSETETDTDTHTELEEDDDEEEEEESDSD